MTSNDRYIRIKFEDTRNELLKFLLGDESTKTVASEYIFE